ncbi:TetR/AcrR family transcriptional regulator [Companilactobacillus huachuanensis]|uniref:TetR/AcrR family transcriptional regulator n=1 Tax=Companilactobacillus huachuanensis TaxID=2559914 RepID=A0ABW1RPS5_9LACO|nr:TetR/AcrR family transcriptional regulator [Companilactobacillus huachuanensis]
MVGLTNQTKNNIIKLTIKIIDEFGYTNISLRKMAKELNLTTGAFYKHFSTKEQLFSEVTVKLSKDIAADAIKNLNKSDIPEKQILQLAYSFLNQYQEHPNIMEFLFFNPTSKSTIADSTTGFEYLDLINHLIAKLIIKRNLDKDKNTLFIQLWSFIQGYGNLIRNNSVQLDKNLIKTTLNDFLRE